MTTSGPIEGKCACCARVRPLEDLVAFWPVDRPDPRRYVCRRGSGARIAADLDCFRRTVGPASVHAIGRAAPAP